MPARRLTPDDLGDLIGEAVRALGLRAGGAGAAAVACAAAPADRLRPADARPDRLVRARAGRDGPGGLTRAAGRDGSALPSLFTGALDRG